MPNGLVDPMVLVGEGADDFCETLGVGIVQNEQLRTESAKKDWVKAKRMLEMNQLEENRNGVNLNSRMDTVGGVAIDVSFETCYFLQYSILAPNWLCRGLCVKWRNFAEEIGSDGPFCAIWVSRLGGTAWTDLSGCFTLRLWRSVDQDGVGGSVG